MIKNEVESSLTMPALGRNVKPSMSEGLLWPSVALSVAIISKRQASKGKSISHPLNPLITRHTFSHRTGVMTRSI